ncbi:F-box/kelch-repeat protein At3g23880-like [Vicia villosa]|uniref:F-box/kelch-repeat protein At3g23880-like n=1 Tax=Vicia villosa TaxID=3911 RepID=UPI00273B8D9E|nr:F-box/kelch-repeat protein At3g23880-like [Vicia villosa]
MTQTPTPVFFPNDLVTEIIPFLPVKSLLRFKCVSNFWNTLISDPTFANLHLKKSKTSSNPQFTLITNHVKPSVDSDWSIIPYPISHLVNNPSATFVADSHYLLNLKDKEWSMAGSCNGLICLVDYSSTNKGFKYQKYQDYRLRLWNPATRKISQKFGYFCDVRGFVFNFGWDDSTSTFKVVASCFSYIKHTREVKVFTIGNNVWRNIEIFPTVPLGLDWRGQRIDKGYEYGCVLLNNTFNWLAFHKRARFNAKFNWSQNVKRITVEDLVIVSLDLRTETYNQYRLPWGFDKLPPEEPNIGLLEECLCLCYSYKETDIAIWQMKKFGVEESWIQFLKINYHILGLDYDISFLPLFLSKDGDTLGLCSSQNEVAILYNLRDNSMRRIEVKVHKTIIDSKTHNSLYLSLAQGYVESLISVC